MVTEYDAYMDVIDEVENRIVDDTKYPVVRDSKIKRCCQITLEITKVIINYLKLNIQNEKKK